MSHRLTPLTVNGHPDDESVNSGGVMARYAAEGVRVVCVVCTRGERGEIVVPTPMSRWRPRPDDLRSRMAAAQRAATTSVDVGPWLEAKHAALGAHATQIRPDSRLLALTPATQRLVCPTEDLTLRASRVASVLPEADLFAGLR